LHDACALVQASITSSAAGLAVDELPAEVLAALDDRKLSTPSTSKISAKRKAEAASLKHQPATAKRAAVSDTVSA